MAIGAIGSGYDHIHQPCTCLLVVQIDDEHVWKELDHVSAFRVDPLLRLGTLDIESGRFNSGN